MNEIKKIKENPQFYKDNFAKRGGNFNIDKMLNLYDEMQTLKKIQEALQMKKNNGAKEFENARKLGDKNLNMLQEILRQNTEKIADITAKYNEIVIEFNKIFIALPNVLDDEVQVGDKEQNVVIKEWGKKTIWNKTMLDHYDVCEKLNLVDYKRGAKISGRGFTLYKDVGAKLEWALLNYMVEMQHGFGHIFLYTPTVMKKECGFNAGQYPNKIDAAWGFGEDAALATHILIPTAETIICNMHIGETLKAEELPIKYFGFSNCYRKEQLAYGSKERGMIRGYEFHKVEMFQFVKPEDNKKALMELLEKTEKIVQGLGLHYRVVKCAAKDVSHAMSETYDVEVYVPSFGYTEVSSVSTAKDYQTMATGTKFIDKDGTAKYVYTLNASGIATSRIIPAICEQFQNADGSVSIPEVLQKYMNGISVIK